MNAKKAMFTKLTKNKDSLRCRRSMVSRERETADDRQRRLGQGRYSERTVALATSTTSLHYPKF